jgi:hypothetical protein
LIISFVVSLFAIISPSAVVATRYADNSGWSGSSFLTMNLFVVMLEIGLAVTDVLS